MSDKAKKIPHFKNEQEERSYWEQHDSTQHIDWSKAEKLSMPELRPSTKSISLRLPEDLLDRIKIIAHSKDIPYQSLIKIWLHEKSHKTYK